MTVKNLCEIESEIINSVKYGQEIPDKTNEWTTKYIGTDYSYKHEIVWKNAIGFLIMHICCLWGFALLITGQIKLLTVIWGK